MAQNWDYAELSKAAKAAGGLEKYVEMLELTSKAAGKMEMLPWIGAAVVGASLVTAAAIKGIDYFKSKRKKNEIEIAKAKECLEFVVKTSTKHGYLGEQVNNETMQPAWVIGLGWSHALFAIVISKLY